jgi:NADH-quinone oxidoreductase subunit H
MRCVACQICEKECPPKCIFIEKSKDKKPDAVGKPQFYPAVFDIDISVCMSCQICVEVCPFDAIKMDPVLLRDWITSFLPGSTRWLADSLIDIASILAVFGLLFAFLTLAERKVLGRVQNRPGPNRTGWMGLLQPFADGIKMLTKEDVVPRAADPVLHFLAPVALLAFSILTFAVIPFGRNLVPLDLDAGVLYFFAAGSATELAIFMAGWASHNKYALFAAMRALAQLISYELPLLLSFVPVVLATGSLSPTGIVAAQAGWRWGAVPNWLVFTPWGAAGFAIFMISALAESNRSPFDLPEAESELIAGHLTEYSGFKYALFFMAEYFGMCALSGMAVTLFWAAGTRPCPCSSSFPPMPGSRLSCSCCSSASSGSGPRCPACGWTS